MIMVTAILIPIICFYFYLLTKKEMKEHDEKWLAAGNVREEAILIGEIKSIDESKERYYYHRYLLVQTIKLQTDAKIITAKRMTPVTKNMEKCLFTPGHFIRLYGSWEGITFLFNRFDSKTPNG